MHPFRAAIERGAKAAASLFDPRLLDPAKASSLRGCSGKTRLVKNETGQDSKRCFLHSRWDSYQGG